MARQYQIQFGLGVLCAVLAGANLIVAGALFFKKRRRVAFQALVLPFAFWIAFPILCAIAVMALEARDGKLLLVVAAVAMATACGSVYLVRAISWPPIPLEEVTPADAKAQEHVKEVWGFFVLLSSTALAVIGAVTMYWSAKFLPDILAPGSGGSAQMLLALFVVPIFLLGGYLFFLGMAGLKRKSNKAEL